MKYYTKIVSFNIRKSRFRLILALFFFSFRSSTVHCKHFLTRIITSKLTFAVELFKRLPCMCNVCSTLHDASVKETKIECFAHSFNSAWQCACGLIANKNVSNNWNLNWNHFLEIVGQWFKFARFESKPN